MLETGQEDDALRHGLAGVRAVSPAVLDVEALLAQLGGDWEMLHRLAQILVREAPERVEQIRRALETDDVEVARRAAHTLKGSGLQLMARAMAEAALAVEHCAKGGDLPGVAAALPALEREVTRLLAEFARLGGEGVA